MYGAPYLSYPECACHLCGNCECTVCMVFSFTRERENYFVLLPSNAKRAIGVDNNQILRKSLNPVLHWYSTCDGLHCCTCMENQC